MGRCGHRCVHALARHDGYRMWVCRYTLVCQTCSVCCCDQQCVLGARKIVLVQKTNFLNTYLLFIYNFGTYIKFRRLSRKVLDKVREDLSMGFDPRKLMRLSYPTIIYLNNFF